MRDKEKKVKQWFGDKRHRRGAATCFAYPYSTEEELFHSGLQCIFYGEVKDIRKYVLRGDSVRDGKKVNLLCQWKYHCEGWVDIALQEEIAKGDHALFLVEGNAMKIRDREKGETIDILGQVSGRLGGYVIENEEYEHLDCLGSRKETIFNYKKHDLLE